MPNSVHERGHEKGPNEMKRDKAGAGGGLRETGKPKKREEEEKISLVR